MKATLLRTAGFLCATLVLCLLGACASTAPDVPVVSSGTPERNDANPGSADLPGARLTGAEPRHF